ncbi:hypothetical protein CCAN11_1960013 [Capnocytophaga canimorsus]|uniref:Uncharacterized protein n=1 Tax=Capnocytophaga canimorsus TaxID=28188 RepID=A0A0B7IHW1_9FLAO|nr:hypothetical protein CCAN11_1960013 [Capnocytophaga canimorsus]
MLSLQTLLQQGVASETEPLVEEKTLSVIDLILNGGTSSVVIIAHTFTYVGSGAFHLL